MASEDYVRDCALRAIADDYEEFERIFHDAGEYAAERGRYISRSETQEALEDLITEGYAKAYELSPDCSPARAVRYSAADLTRLWFYVTPSGKERAKELKKDWQQIG